MQAVERGQGKPADDGREEQRVGRGGIVSHVSVHGRDVACGAAGAHVPAFTGWEEVGGRDASLQAWHQSGLGQFGVRVESELCSGPKSRSFSR